jgi:hypothetical protein
MHIIYTACLHHWQGAPQHHYSGCNALVQAALVYQGTYLPHFSYSHSHSETPCSFLWSSANVSASSPRLLYCYMQVLCAQMLCYTCFLVSIMCGQTFQINMMHQHSTSLQCQLGHNVAKKCTKRLFLMDWQPICSDLLQSFSAWSAMVAALAYLHHQQQFFMSFFKITMLHTVWSGIDSDRTSEQSRADLGELRLVFRAALFIFKQMFCCAFMFSVSHLLSARRPTTPVHRVRVPVCFLRAHLITIVKLFCTLILLTAWCHLQNAKWMWPAIKLFDVLVGEHPIYSSWGVWTALERKCITDKVTEHGSRHCAASTCPNILNMWLQWQVAIWNLVWPNQIDEQNPFKLDLLLSFCLSGTPPLSEALHPWWWVTIILGILDQIGSVLCRFAARRQIIFD